MKSYFINRVWGLLLLSTCCADAKISATVDIKPQVFSFVNSIFYYNDIKMFIPQNPVYNR